jgi:hypothetical protein
MTRQMEIGSAEATSVDLDVLMERIRAELRGTASGSSSTNTDSVAMASRKKESDNQLADRNPRRYRFSEFASVDIETFVRNAYLAALGREPDEMGYYITLHRLESGQTGRASLLLELLNSDEGRQRGATIPGLGVRRSMESFWYNRYVRLIKVVGRLLFNSPRIANHVRQLASQALAAERLAAKALATSESAQRLAQSSAMEQTSQITEWMDRRIFERTAPLERLITEARLEINSTRGEIDRRLTDYWRHVVDQKLRLETLLAEVRRRMPEPLTYEQVGELLSEEQQLLDALYVSLEDRYRGTRTDIKNRQKIYLKDIKNAVLAADHAPILDVGCGRGEWLELLKENEFSAYGYDSNRVMIAEARNYDLDVRLGDALRVFLKCQMPA